MFSAGNVPGGVQEASKAVGTGPDGGSRGGPGALRPRMERPGDATPGQTGAELRQGMPEKILDINEQKLL